MKTFVASPTDVYHDDEAAAMLRDTNDSRFMTVLGVVSVDRARWEKAQRYERETWLTYNLDARSDRNEAHREAFGGYAALPYDLGDCIELGCGPFTNLRYILDGHKASSIWLLDPLIKEYEFSHPNCAYKGWQMHGQQVQPINDAIEAWRGVRQFDTVVMVNTLAHCYDVHRVFKTIRRILKLDGILIFCEGAKTEQPTDFYDVGHPLTMTQAVIDAFLSRFEPMYHSGDYFIGRYR